MANGFFKVCVCLSGSSVGYTLPATSEQLHHASVLTERVLLAMNTHRAFLCLRRIAMVWSAVHHPHLNPTNAANNFQTTLATARTSRGLWPALALEYDHPEIWGAFGRNTTASQQATEFRMSDYIFFLNGHRLYLYTEDVRRRKNEKYVRWFELFVTYLHEIGHMFITYLSLRYERNNRCHTPTFAKLSYYHRSDSGYLLEHFMFGGVLEMYQHNQVPSQPFTLGVPTLETTRGQQGISLDSILKLAGKKGPYDSKDFELHLYEPNRVLRGQGSPRTEYFTFFQSWWKHFKQEYAELNVLPPGWNPNTLPHLLLMGRSAGDPLVDLRVYDSPLQCGGRRLLRKIKHGGDDYGLRQEQGNKREEVELLVNKMEQLWLDRGLPEVGKLSSGSLHMGTEKPTVTTTIPIGGNSDPQLLSIRRDTKKMKTNA